MTIDKVVNPGTGRDGGVFCKIQYDGAKLSISGVIGPKSNGYARGSCGQIVDSMSDAIDGWAPGWSEALLAQFVETWRAWHLNDMRASCEHQREWDTRAPLTLRPLTWGPEYHRRRRAAEDGTMRADEFATWGETVRMVARLTLGFNPPKHPDLWGADGERMLALQLVKEEKPETKAAGWVTEKEHPAGLLSKPCPTCGYKYGSAWLKEDVPADVLEFLESLPVTTVKPAWV